MMAAGRLPRATLGLLFAVLAVSGLAAAVPAHAQEQIPALFSAIPEGVQPPPSLDARSAYMVDSEMVVLNTVALQAASVNATILGDTYTISREYIDVRDGGDYTWFGSGDRVSDAILVVNGTEVVGLIYAQNRTFEILHVSSDVHEIYELDMSRFPPEGTGSDRADTASGASAAAAAVPAAPTNLMAASTANTVTLSWTAPNDNTITNYKIYSRAVATESILTLLLSNVSSSATSHVVTGLEAGAAYQFAMSSVNSRGDSAVSSVVSISTKNPPPSPQPPAAIPAAPTNLMAASTANTVTLSWTAPNDNTITNYKIYSRAVATESILTLLLSNVSSSATSHVVTGLEAGAAYQFAMSSVNSRGDSAVSSVVSISTKPAN